MMTDERIAEIERVIENWRWRGGPAPSVLHFCVELLAEVKRLRAELERGRGEAVASGEVNK